MRRFLLLLSLCTVLAVIACDEDTIDPVEDDQPVWETRVIRDIDFVKDTYFFLTYYGGDLLPDPAEDFRVYKELKPIDLINDPSINAGWGFAFDDISGTGLRIRDALADVPGGGAVDETGSQQGWFAELVLGVDYFFVVDAEDGITLRGIELAEPIGPSEVRALAVEYTTTRGDQVGGQKINLLRPMPTAPDTLALKLIKPRVPGPADATWDYMMRNIYDLGWTDIDGAMFELVIEDNLVPRTDATHPLADPDTLSVPYLRIFGLDRTDETGLGPSDGLVDLGTGVVDLMSGRLTLPSSAPFAPSEQSVREWTDDEFWFLDPRFGIVDGKPRFQLQYERAQQIYETVPSAPEFQNLYQYNIVVRAAFPAGN